jgi:type II secretory pathway pseudopilin PulG
LNQINALKQVTLPMNTVPPSPLLNQISTKVENKKQQGSTLIELILYIALLAVFLSGAILFSWNIILSEAKSGTQREVIQNIRLASERISYEIRNASAILSLTSNAICLESPNSTYNPTRIYLETSALMIGWGGGSNDCTNLTNTQALSSGDISISNLEFTDQSNTSLSTNVGYTFTADILGTRQEWQSSQTMTGSVEVRTPN